MINQSVHQNAAGAKAIELGISEDIMTCALSILSQNRNFVNAIDNSVEMDDYIYRAILKRSFDKRKQRSESGLYSEDLNIQIEAQKDLTVLSREELSSDPFYRAVLPLIVKVVINESILRLHAEEASAIILKLADIKRRYRATSLTEVIVKRCSIEIEKFSA